MDLREVGNDGKDWINLAQDRDRWRLDGWRQGNTFFVETLPSKGLGCWGEFGRRRVEDRRCCDQEEDSGGADEVGLVGAVSIALAFYARGCGFDLGPGRWHTIRLQSQGWGTPWKKPIHETKAGSNPSPNAAPDQQPSESAD
ncbi:hypothetical protein ANN_03046 [Periplaneta americana]|uniref:Uncharacterized protein n=1 Tax=Periplaneta americana TaxID=6978 RepID=A0ABQ8U162_PERAM|nr:hypothetical protein ANN_03046 [Periplaneta americana]